MATITQKQVYEDAILCMSKDHIHQTKWVTKLDTLILWEEVWDSVHNFPMSNKTKSIIWEQIHLNYYTQYSYNKWHGKMDRCPLCNKIPENIFHIILHCDFVNFLWTQLQPTLNQLHNKPLNDEEKALGIVNIKKSTGMILRNWLTYKMREMIMQFERESYATKSVSFELLKAKFNQAMAYEIKGLMIKHKNENRLTKFDTIIAYRGILCKKIQEGEYKYQIILK